MRTATLAIALTLTTAATIAQSQTSSSWDEKFRALPQPENIRANMQRLAARPHHVGSPYAKENAEWMLAQFKAWGWDASIEQFDVLFPDSERAPPRNGRADQIRREARRADRHHRSDERTEDRAVAVVQRVFDRRRRHRAAGVRQLRPRRRLRPARAPGRLRSRRHRDRPLRPDFPWREVEDRGRARRRRLPHLLGSARRWVLRRRGVSQRADAAERRRAARIGRGSRERIRRSADAGHWRASLARRGWRSATRRISRRFPRCRFHTATRSRSWPRLPARWRRSTGEARCRFRIASARVRRKSI